MFIGKAILKGN